jgi:hypothetical protein
MTINPNKKDSLNVTFYCLINDNNYYNQASNDNYSAPK